MRDDKTAVERLPLGNHGGAPSRFERYLACGTLAHGFARVRCTPCGDEMLVAFSCKATGFAPPAPRAACRRTATHLLDCVLPHVPMRQWVLSLPRAGCRGTRRWRSSGAQRSSRE